MAPMSEARKRANKKWNDANMKKKYDRIQLVLPKGMKRDIQSAAVAAGESVNAYIYRAIMKQMQDGTGAPAVSPAVEDGPGAVMVSAEGSPEENICSRFTSLTRPDSATGQPDDEPEFIKVIKRLGAMSPEELDKQFGTDPEGIERYREQMERKRQRLAELNAKAGGLSRAEDAERRRLTVECKHYPDSGASTQE